MYRRRKIRIVLVEARACRCLPHGMMCRISQPKYDVDVNVKLPTSTKILAHVSIGADVSCGPKNPQRHARPSSDLTSYLQNSGALDRSHSRGVDIPLQRSECPFCGFADDDTTPSLVL